MTQPVIMGTGATWQVSQKEPRPLSRRTQLSPARLLVHFHSGVGSDPREDRYFSIPKQSATYDPEAKYMKHWCPELAVLTSEALLKPQMLTDPARRKAFGITDDVYPLPVVPLKFGSGPSGSGGGGGGYQGGGRGGQRRGPGAPPRRPNSGGGGGGGGGGGRRGGGGRL